MVLIIPCPSAHPVFGVPVEGCRECARSYYISFARAMLERLWYRCFPLTFELYAKRNTDRWYHVDMTRMGAGIQCGWR